MREALELVIAGTAAKSKPLLYDVNQDLFPNLGQGGPEDLFTNLKHLNDLGQLAASSCRIPARCWRCFSETMLPTSGS